MAVGGTARLEQLSPIEVAEYASIIRKHLNCMHHADVTFVD